MADKIGLVILAAGEGTRLKLDLPKPLAPVMGKTLVDFTLKTSKQFINTTGLDGEACLVVGHKNEEVKKHISENWSTSDLQYSFALQEKQLGTGDALRSYFEKNARSKDTNYTIVLCADTPIIESKHLEKLLNELQKNNLDGVAATFRASNPFGYGRIVRSEKGFHIVEEKDANDEQRIITEVNSGLYIFKTKFVLEHLGELDTNNKSGEFYLTDLFKNDYNVKPSFFENPEIFLGVNTLEQLETAQNILNKRKVSELRDRGVRFIDSSSVYIEDDVEVEAGTTIFPNVYLAGKTTIGPKAVIQLGSFIQDSVINEGCTIKSYSHLEGAAVSQMAQVGPFARLRNGSKIGKKTKIGNFVETKNVEIGSGVGISHLSYLGDAEVGDDTNIGCGFVTCNYDGESKHKTIIGKKCFIGSDSQVIAPLQIGDNSYVASGSTINQDIPKEGFAVARGRQVTKEGMAKRFLKGKWSLK